MEETLKAGRRGRSRSGDAAAGERNTEWQNLVADVEDLVKRVADVDDEEIAEIRSRVEGTLARAKKSASAGLAEARDRAEEVTDATDEYVRENPWAAVGIAAAIGIVIGLLAGRR
jgi:ElaB/YqjD/DUF883 family membrane-anchored ribosome-binding protein